MQNRPALDGINLFEEDYRLSSKWGVMIRHVYNELNHRTVYNNTTQKKCKYYAPESWAKAKGLISLNWEFVDLLWEERIKLSKSNQEESPKSPNHYFILQEAIYKLDNHHITNLSDRD